MNRFLDIKHLLGRVAILLAIPVLMVAACFLYELLTKPEYRQSSDIGILTIWLSMAAIFWGTIGLLAEAAWFWWRDKPLRRNADLLLVGIVVLLAFGWRFLFII